MSKKKLTFVDIFSGIGGFHQALNKVGCKCVCASEIDEACKKVYRDNFPTTKILGDIKKEYTNLPSFDILCGGFPCQPFSKAGKQEGFNDPIRGNLFYTLMDIIENHKECNFVILENVKNLADNSQNWIQIQKALNKLDFCVTDKPIIISPHQIGIPQIRERVYILGIRKTILDKKKLPNGTIRIEDLKHVLNDNELCKVGDARKIIDKNAKREYIISDVEKNVLKMWMEFKKGTLYEKIGVPIWVEYFGYKMTDSQYKMFKDHNNKKINDMPKWKKRFALKNREFYLKHKTFIDMWIKKHDVLSMPLLHKKFEWNCGDEKDLRKTIIQFRQSGIRVKKMDYFPALVAINNTPIIYDYKLKEYRRITPKEAARLQSFDSCFIIKDKKNIYKQLGNAVNVEVVFRLAKELLSFSKKEK